MSTDIPTRALFILEGPVLCRYCPKDAQNDLRFMMCSNTKDQCVDCCGEEH